MKMDMEARAALMIYFMLVGHKVELILGNSHENALNLPQLLLPYAADGLKPTTFQLRALRGCFKWSSTKKNVAIVTPANDVCNRSLQIMEDENACSQSALVEVKTKIKGEDTTVILAEEEGTGTILRCDVFVDVIDHISIATTARELLIGESPEVFDVFAYDKEGNLFSALGSTTFEWNIAPLGHVERADQSSVLKMLWFHDSVYETSQDIYHLESELLRGSSILIEGISTGDAIVSAKVSHPENENVKTSVKVTVLDNVILIPPYEYILVHQLVKYSAMQLRRGKRKVISLPSEQYYLKVVDEGIGQLNATDVSVRGLSVGVTKVQLVDKNTANLSSARLPTASLNVVDPANIGFAINPGKLWVLETGREYHMHVRLFDGENNRVTIDENVIFNSVLLEEYFDIHVKSINQTYFVVQPKKVGRTVLTSALIGVKYGDEVKAPSKITQGEQNIEIYDPITLTPQHVLIPWDHYISGIQLYQQQLIASGGSGNYIWSSVDSNIAVVNKGLVSAGAIAGMTKINVLDVKNTNHSAQAIINVLSPSEIAFIDGQVEALVSSYLKLSLSASTFLSKVAKEKSYFKDCRKMKLQLSFSDDNIFKEVPSDDSIELPDEGCTTIFLEGLSPGHTTLTATYTYADVTLRAAIVIAAYNPVTVVDPFEYATVTLGSTRRIIAEAGPLPWILDSNQYQHIISAEEEEWVRITQVTMTDNTNVAGRAEHLFDVTCNSIGVQVLTVFVLNGATSKNKFPAESSATTRFVCAPPAALKLVPLITLPEIDGTRRSLESCKDDHNRIPVLNDRELTLHLLVYDTNGNLFDDASSLNIDWLTDDTTTAEFLNSSTKSAVKRANPVTKTNGGVQLFEVLQVYPKQSSVTVTAKIVSYKEGHIEQSIQPITAKLLMVTVTAPMISPNMLNMFVHPLNQPSLAVSGGTQNFVMKNTSHMDLVYFPSANIKVTPKSEGAETIYLYDACLDTKKPAEAYVILSDIYSIVLNTADKVEIGQTIEVKCTAYDQGRKELVISEDAIGEVNLELRMSINIVSIEKEEASAITQKNYILNGKSVGVTTLSCHATQTTGIEVSSKASDVQVFSPLELDPKYILLIVGSIYQIHSRGGPRPHSTTVYSCTNETVANVDKSGLVTANVVGKTVITGEARGAVVYSQDQTIVEVIRLKGFKISLKSQNLITSTEVGVLAVGISDEDPFTFATSPPYLRFHWTSSNHKVVIVESFHYKAGVGIGSDKDFRAIIQVLRPGHVTIKLRVDVLSNDFGQVSELAKLEDEIEIQVFEKFQLLHPISGGLLLPNNGVDKLLTNKDQVVSVSYDIVPSCPGINKDSVISILNNGQITAASSSGVANVVLTAHEDFGFNQTLLVQIEVKPVASITLVSNSHFVITGKEHPSFPIGSTIEFGVTLHDNVARKFDVSSIPLVHTTTRSDVVQVIPNLGDVTFTIRASNVGETILKVWDKENPSTSDFVRISITDGIVPSKATITIGELICFQAGVSSGNGIWTTETNLLYINQQSGIAVGLSVGSILIHYQEKSYKTDTEVTVVNPSIPPMIINSDDSSNISNNEENRLFFVKMEMKSNSCSEATISLAPDIIPFSCIASWDARLELSVDEVFRVEAVYLNGVPACSLTSLALSSEKAKKLSVGERILTLHVRLTDANSRHEFVSVPHDIRFIPRFYVDGESINFNIQETSKVVKVVGAAVDLDSMLISSDSSALTITRIDDTVEVAASNIPASDFNTSITFYSPLTKHSLVLPVTIKGAPATVETPQCPVESGEEVPVPLWSVWYGESGFLVFTVIIATLILIVIYHIVTKKTQIRPVLVPPPPYSPYVVGRINSDSSTYNLAGSPFNSPRSPYNSPGSPNSRSARPNAPLFSVSQ